METHSFKSLYEARTIILKIKSTLSDHLSVGDGEGMQEDDDSQGLGLMQQHGYNEWKYKHKRRNSLEDRGPVLDMFAATPKWPSWLQVLFPACCYSSTFAKNLFPT